MKKLQLEIPCPPSVNSLYRNVQGIGRVRSTAYKRWQKAAEAAIAKHPAFPVIRGAYRIQMLVGMWDNRRRDILNLDKAPPDFLVHLGLVPDDCLIMGGGIDWSLDVRPRIMQVTITETKLLKFDKAAAIKKWGKV
jgi:Holliday junction resolvase RusA-like endonuclease